MIWDRRRKLKLGVVANEFFDDSIGRSGRFGGFGWATRQLARTFGANPDLGVDVVFLGREFEAARRREVLNVHGCRLIPLQPRRLDYARMVRSERLDLLLSIDYRPSYRDLFQLLPRTPIIVWVRDPRPPKDMERVLSIRVPGQEHVEGQGLVTPDCTSLADVVASSERRRRQVIFATPAPFLADKVPGTYGVHPEEVHVLPNIIDMEPDTHRKSERPLAVFLGRLDPYKRPWIFAELAKSFPDVEFVFCGKSHFSGPGSWQPTHLAPNVRVMGHVDGQDKVRLLSSAWVLVNTSVHEGLAVSFQEALRCETPVLSSVNPQGVVQRFGIYVGDYKGTGLEALPGFRDGLARLLKDEPLRKRLGREGREWVTATHSRQAFLASFRKLCMLARVRSNSVPEPECLTECSPTS